MHKERRVNDRIRVPMVQLVMDDGSMVGVISTSEALAMADERSLDLVEVSTSNNGSPPICKLLDYGKLKYEESKRQKHQPKHHVKEIKCSFNISDHDLQTKHRKVEEFLKKRYKVTYILELRGREKGLVPQAKEKIANDLKPFAGLATWKSPQISQAKNATRLTVSLAPK